MPMGSILIKTARGSRIAQFFWDDKKAFLDIENDDGSIKRRQLKSPRQARRQAWIASQDAFKVGFKAQAF